MAQMNAFPPQNVVTVPPGRGGGGGLPVGLDYLSSVNELRIKQQIECIEIICGCEQQNRYKINNSAGEQVFFAMEGDTSCFSRNCLRALRPFQMRITDNANGEIIRLTRPCRCGSCWYPCCLQELTVLSPQTGVVLGFVKQEWSILFPRYRIENANHETVLKIRGPLCPISCFFCDVHFKIYSADGETEVGEIRKEWSGCLKEWCTDADNFTITFDTDVDVEAKATVLGAVFLVDFMLFEH